MPVPTEIRKLSGGSGMKISWPDGTVKEYSARALRQECRCAACRHELTGERLLRSDGIPADITILKAEILGQYALSLHFSDGHNTGIYTFENLYRDMPVADPSA